MGSNGQLRRNICASTHDSSEEGHSCIFVSIKRAKTLFYWLGLKRDITAYVRECDICQRNKFEHVPNPGLLQPIPILDKSWEVVSMDFIEGLPRSA